MERQQLTIEVFHSAVSKAEEAPIHTPFQKWIARLFRLHLRRKFIHTIRVQAANYPVVSPGEIFVSAEGINWVIMEIDKYHPHIITMVCLSPQDHPKLPDRGTIMAPVAKAFVEKSAK